MNILFDLDDTLVNTSQIVFRSMQEWCELHSIDLDLAIEKGRGRRTEDTVALLAPHLNVQQEAQWIDEREGQLIDSIQAMPGAVNFVSKLKESSWAVVTSSSYELAIKKLRVCKLPIPKVLVTAESVEQGKPSSEPYVKAMELLGVSPDHCLVFEDAESGIASAVTAGCEVIVIGEYTGTIDKKVVGRIKSFDQLYMSEKGLVSIEYQSK